MKHLKPLSVDLISWNYKWLQIFIDQGLKFVKSPTNNQLDLHLTIVNEAYKQIVNLTRLKCIISIIVT